MDALRAAQRCIVEPQALLFWVDWAPIATGFSGETPLLRQPFISAQPAMRSGDDKVDNSFDEPSREAHCRLACDAQIIG